MTDPSRTQVFVGRYELIAPLGGGGMGRVYHARLRGPGLASKPVALKTLHGHLAADHTFVQMFLEEARIAMALQHRNIVQTFDGGWADGRYFLVMELVRGCSLGRLLKRHGGPLPPRIALFIGMELCTALDYAHTFRSEDVDHPGGVLHRDVSPGNVLLSDRGDVKLADFGVAKAAGPGAGFRDNLVRGKFPYMAPEQARAQEVIHSDLFSLGAVLFEMVTGARLRDEATLESVETGELDISPLRCRGLNGTLQETILTCLARSPVDRPPSARALRALLAGELERLDVGPDPGLDPHGPLQSLVGQLVGAPPPDEQAAQLVERMLLEAEAVPPVADTDTNLNVNVNANANASATLSFSLAGAGPDELTAALEQLRRASTEPDGPAAPPVIREPSSRPLVLASLLLVASAIIVVLLLVPGPKVPSRLTAAPPAPASPGAPRVIPLDAAAARTGPAAPGSEAMLGGEAPAKTPGARASTRTAPSSGRSERSVPARGRPGRLSINSLPWAKVYVDGAHRGNTPVQNLNLEPGEHRLRLVNPESNLSRSLRVVIRPGQSVSRVVMLR